MRFVACLAACKFTLLPASGTTRGTADSERLLGFWCCIHARRKCCARARAEWWSKSNRCSRYQLRPTRSRRHGGTF